MIAENWTPFVPVLKGSVSDPVLGSGGQTCQGRWLLQGKLIVCQFVWQWGSSGTGFGSGNYGLLLPVAADIAQTGLMPVGSGYFFDWSTGVSSSIGVVMESTSQAMLWCLNNSANTRLTPTTPIAFANNDVIAASFAYNIP